MKLNDSEVKKFKIMLNGQQVDTVWTGPRGNARSVLKIIRVDFGVEKGDKFKAILVK